jgi:hypothetical protein
LNIELDSAKAREDTSLQHTLEKKIAKDEKQLKTLDKQTKLALKQKDLLTMYLILIFRLMRFWTK